MKQIEIKQMKMRKRSYLVVGLYEDEKRYAATFKAFTAEEAEQMAHHDNISGIPLTIAGVIYKGKIES